MLPVSRRDNAITNVPHFDVKTIRLTEIIAKGNFGIVHKAIIGSSKEHVAIKIVRKDLAAEREAILNYNLSHESIIRFYGLAHSGRDTMLIFQMMGLGSLKKVLLESVPPPMPGYQAPENARILHVYDLLNICRQIASGLAYLASKNIVHCDLATRNCLVSSTASGISPYLVKVTDFGLSRQLDPASSYYTFLKTDILPVVMAPECLHTLWYDHRSDMWSFGIVMWEVFSFGERPYAVSESEPFDTIRQRITSGTFPDQPRCCPGSFLAVLRCFPADNIYRFMKTCSDMDPYARPTAAEAEAYLNSRLIEVLIEREKNVVQNDKLDANFS